MRAVVIGVCAPLIGQGRISSVVVRIRFCR
jgi:hypothetical protein